MRLIASNIAVPLDAMLPNKRKALRRVVAKAVGVDAANVHDLRIVRRSVDARKKSNVHFVVSVTFKLMGERPDSFTWPCKSAKGVKVAPYEEPAPLAIPDLSALASGDAPRPLVVGAGPAGLFCALWLARAGLRPIVVERGPAVEDRAEAVAAFDAGAPLDPDANIQFGEGGAGAFSDGKLTCGRTDPHMRHVLQAFVDAGAPGDILIDAKPHIGTDYLPRTVRGLREAIQRAGGEVRFDTQLSGIFLNSCSSSECIQGIMLCDLPSGKEYRMATDTVVLAIGHSARDTLHMLREAGIPLQRKPFAVGVRIEHPQELIDRAQYGCAAGHRALPPADYKLNVRTDDGRGVYTFCMCPGGTVVAAASEPGGVCTNGMSNHARDGRNANSALLVEVRPEDLPGDDALEGVRFQRAIERAAYDLAQQTAAAIPFTAPAQTVGSFLGVSGGAAVVEPTYPRGTVTADLRACLPRFVADALAEALPKLDRKLHGFADPGAMMTAVEARSSSPVRIPRDRRTQESTNIAGLYPAGEGGGHAGGIMSAATDGIRTAESIMRAFALRHTAATPAQAEARLCDGAPVIFPTDTVAGLGLAPRFAVSPRTIYMLKGRPDAKPISWLVGSAAALDELASAAPDYARRLARRFWPGALTLVVKASGRVPAAYTADGTIGLRMPADPTALALINAVGPIAATSANPAGAPAPEIPRQADPQLMLEVGCTCVPGDGAASRESAGIASTVVDCTGPAPRILREGTIPAADILSI